MKYVDRKTFLGLPAGVFYARVDRRPNAVGIYDNLEVKGETLPSGRDFWSTAIVGLATPDDDDRCNGEILMEQEQAMRSAGASFPMNDTMVRYGLYDEDQMFMIFERGDLRRLRDLVDAAMEATPA